MSLQSLTTADEAPSVEWLSRSRLEDAAKRHIEPTRVVLDVGCGLRPQGFFKAEAHLCCEPHGEYAKRLQRAFRRDPGVVVIESTAGELLPRMPDNSVDTVFAIDVIEHLTREDGLELVRHAERVARRQVVLFTPLGFMPQEYDEHDTDGWGLRGGHWQAHRSGWTPEDFSGGWRFFVCRDFHNVNGKGESFAEPHGAFWAIKDKASAEDAAPALLLVSNAFPPDHAPSSLALSPIFADHSPQSLTLLSTQDYTPHAVIGRVGKIPTDAAGMAGLESRAVWLRPAMNPASLPGWLARGAARWLVRPCVKQIVEEAKATGAKAILATIEGKVELAAASAAARGLRLPLVAVVHEGYRKKARRLGGASFRDRVLSQADLVWSPGDPETAAELAKGGQKHSGSNRLADALASLGLTTSQVASAGAPTTPSADAA